MKASSRLGRLVGAGCPNNYDFCARWVLDQRPAGNACVLDFGCGEGQIVDELRRSSIDAYGCDVFYEGANYSRLRESAHVRDGIIRAMNGNTIPFKDASFDFVINNQVLEHVEDLDAVLGEIRRVLKPGGAVLSLFPDRGVWREGHCGIPLLHRFPKGSQARIYYAAAFRALGFGYHKEAKSVMRWSRDFCDWLDRWTHYRTWKEIHHHFHSQFTGIDHIEDYWLQQRLGDRARLIRRVPASLQRLLVNKLAGIIMVARKAP